MKKKDSWLMVAVLALCLTLLCSVCTVHADTEDGFVWIERPFTLYTEHFSEDTAKLNCRAFLMLGDGDYRLPYTVTIKQMQLWIDGNLFEDYTVSTGLNIANSDKVDSVRTAESVTIEKGTVCEGYQQCIFNDGTKEITAGDYEGVIRILLRADDVEGPFYMENAAITFDVWDHKLNTTLYPCAGFDCNFEEMQAGTLKYQGKSFIETEKLEPSTEYGNTANKSSYITPSANTTANTEKEEAQKPTFAPSSGVVIQDSGSDITLAIVIALVVIVVAAIFVLFSKKK